jgi:hypothetical protein
MSRVQVHDLFVEALAYGLARIDELTDEELDRIEEQHEPV